ncbi:SGNH hydrolase [Daldinia caldariorum]|uniref:SGNH hydrolase n=1 Tax=Daldinia caldariorum TaxID=326644 RepID=UPI0020073ACA|nr:SGNH hydrolase [Daldinia caldariorum]KAI1469574.1 SGNH hydrolase [Daldinia caldariorum]
MKLDFAMRPAAVLTSIILSRFVSCRALRQHPLIASGDHQYAIGHGVSGYHRRPPSPIPSASSKDIKPVAGFIALGDSYSAGIGTGVDGKEDDCRRGLGAHAVLIASDLLASQGGRNSTTFQFLSCTGATTEQILSSRDGSRDSQIDAFNTSLPADFALLSIGGNDLGFFDIMNACVFRFYNFYSRACETALKNARDQIESDEFTRRLEIIIIEILERVRWEKKQYFTITVTGYARFFNDVTDDCDEMSFGVWWNGPKLKKDLRIRMNAMVLTVNAKIRETIETINSHFIKDKVIFIDYDRGFDGHRFCEEGVKEPDYDREDTWFFLVGGPDNARNGTRSNHVSNVQTLPLTSALVDPSSCLEPAQASGDWGRLALCYMAMAKHQDPSLQPAHGDLVAENSMWYVPTYYGKTFHPRSLGHETIRNKIYEIWQTLE